MKMFVIKRNGESERVSFDKVLTRLDNLSHNLPNVNVEEIAQKTCSRIYNNVHTYELDELASELCSSLISCHPDYGILASRLIISNYHKRTSPSFSETITLLHQNKIIDENNSLIPNPLVSDELYNIVMNNRGKLNNYIDYSRDYLIDYFGFKTLEKTYLIKVNNVPIERPQHLFMRVALGIHGTDLKDAFQTYDMMSKRYFVHATPTLFNAGTPHPQMSSCFLLDMHDSIKGIYKTLANTADISQHAGGIGINLSHIRAKGSRIRGTNGVSNGIIPMLKVFNSSSLYVDQGGGKRAGSMAFYIEPWHGDIFDFLDLRKNTGLEEERSRALFTAIWIPDLFMERVSHNAKWSLMCPDKCPHLNDVWGDEFKALYEKYESDGKYIKQIDALQLWYKILEAQIETGTPYIGYKDAVNKKSNMKNVGIIRNSNLCHEITIYSSTEEYGTCNLASMCLPSYIDTSASSSATFNFDKLHEAIKVVTKNLNKVIDRNFYPVEESKRSNLRHRPIGIGISGLADVFVLMRFPFESEEARKLNKDIAETMYHGALEASMEIAQKRALLYEEMMDSLNMNTERYAEISKHLNLNKYEINELDYGHIGAYATFNGSPMSKGILQFDMWDDAPTQTNERYDWDLLKSQIKNYGVRNCLMIALMPTATTAHIMGFNEAFEPFTSNLYSRSTKAGEFIQINKYMVNDLMERGLWNEDLRQKIIKTQGILRDIPEIPNDLKELYKTAWEIKQKAILNMAADRGAYVCQTQSMNLFVEKPTKDILTTMHFYAWRKGLKTGMYYLRTKPKATAQQFTIDPTLTLATSATSTTVSTSASTEECLSCSA